MLDEGVSSDDVDDKTTLETLVTYPDVTVAEGWGQNIFLWKEPDDAGYIESSIWGVYGDWDTLQVLPSL